ncbi:glucose-6-phosphate isomerase [Flavobacterium chuncheonense]|uniref:Glucose-6-phosphate isomerase n=1 Tax=Flavobacterium chuncheonense TaxID=2026653 RepID=A0ABW5YMH6_9FLAO
MTVTSINPTLTKTWEKLSNHFASIKDVKMQDLFTEDPKRVQDFHIKWNEFLLDFSKNRITKETMSLLVELADELKLKDAISDYFSGTNINRTEDRAVLHTALRSKDSVILVDNINIIPEVEAAKEKLKVFSESVISGSRKGVTGKAFTDIVNIGIGGSDLGPDMVTEALKFYKNHLDVHFISNIDGDDVAAKLSKLNPETTLFVVVSKTFTTQETIVNATTVKKWLESYLGESAVASHFVAVSTNPEKVVEFGIATDDMFPMWDWVGGRFSLWSPVGLSIVLAIGYSNFEQLLDGANDMDQHFRTADFNVNIPVILALLSVWYNNFFGAETEAVIPYSQYLQKLVPYLQQGVMESNGKGTSRTGEKVTYQTGTIVWGQTGSNCQHAFFQLFHQGTKLIPTDFIGFKNSLSGNKQHHDILMANFFAQTEALLWGKSIEVLNDENEFLKAFKVFEGNKPTNTLLIDKLKPKSIGSLIAMYEHKIFVQGIIWNIFSYDQWGVELGKQLAKNILSEIEGDSNHKHDSSTSFLLKEYLK